MAKQQSYQAVYDDHLAEFYVYNRLHDRTFDFNRLDAFALSSYLIGSIRKPISMSTQHQNRVS